ncbi:hypothetical protein G7Y89_g1584 [Cudoniella acicularis]|uniref:Cytochrome P450 n=1 Tax=Cudoniella acicularis TaxID=354080 RepID=A0A8H4RV08_9HELO|nr:hypothetical protein G7Y89_g1584 [Cudoniella acicularis]
MSPQGGMNEMLLAAVNVTKERLDSLHQGIHRTEVDLWAWTQHELTVITTESVYGPGNPYKDPKVEVGFWDFADDTIKLLLTNILPNIVASKALAGREVVVQAMDSYFSCGAYKEGSSLVKARHAALKDGEIPDLDLARCECVNGIAILANTVPTAFWTIFHIFSDPLVLTEVRRQVGLITTYQVLTEGGGPAYKINLSRLNDAPIIFSALQEALRLRATGTGPRMVLADTFIGPHQYLLKKGSVVMIVNKALHSDKGAWGEKADTYHPDRFYGKFPAQSFRGFGGGVNLCPGRGFAMVEVAALVAMLAMRFDLVPAGETWSEPDQDLTNLSLQVAPPKQKVTVNIVPRHDFEEASWYFEL